MRERIIKFIETENLAPTKFADEIGVQRSSISHILSGRNNPSFDFIQKILARYKALNAEWLVMGTGPMYKAMEQGNLFSVPKQELNLFNQPAENKQIIKPETDNNINTKEQKLADNIKDVILNNTEKLIDRIVFFYSDKSFSVFIPEK
jgi:transcriptional regulator with XRE-family HTH domain